MTFFGNLNPFGVNGKSVMVGVIVDAKRGSRSANE
jgi:hypothetical protein